VNVPSELVCVEIDFPLIATVTLDIEVPSDALVTFPEIVFVCAQRLDESITPERINSNFLFMLGMFGLYN